MAYKMKYKGYIGKTKSPMKESFRQARRRKEKELEIDKLDAEMANVQLDVLDKQRQYGANKARDAALYGSN